jgi:predicted unusual protein kinase regulating ubiquinone biosynthesis (AarF/ABC1/UbiB family)
MVQITYDNAAGTTGTAPGRAARRGQIAAHRAPRAGRAAEITPTVAASATGVHHRSSLGRARQIAETLAKYELPFLIHALDLDRFLPMHHGDSGHTAAAPLDQPARLRMALAELGPTFIKLAQILSTRGDLLPPAYQSELATLQDAAPALPVEEVSATIMAELGQPPEQVFASFEATPIAAASIGQVHRATLPDGTSVVVKVRRPGAVEEIDEDLKLLHSLAAVASKRWEAARQYDVVALVQEFDRCAPSWTTCTRGTTPSASPRTSLMSPRCTSHVWSGR